jgi:uncharacterized protein (DUF1800 family)
VHLHRRAGFGATWRELQRDLADSPETAVERVLQGNCRLDGVAGEFDALARGIGDAAVGSNDFTRLQAWWYYRLLFTPDPLGEKLALMWHNHFATSNEKVDDLSAMRNQIELYYRHGRGPFGELLAAVAHDPAMLIWLDAPSNRIGNANENLAREIMELFTLGVGNYTEQDVKQGARALTGWSLRQGAFFADDSGHDAGEKTILGARGKWTGDDFIRILLDQPAAARRIAWRLCRTFMGAGVVDDAALEELAHDLRTSNLDVGRAVATILRSQLFFSETNLASRVSDPAEFIVSAVRPLELFSPPPATLRLARWSTQMGLPLFYPPNVGGWPGGPDWLSSHYVVARANFAAALAAGEFNCTPDVGGLAERHMGRDGLEASLEFLNHLILGGRLSRQSSERITTEIHGREGTDTDRLRWLLAVLLALPESQLV